MIPRFLTPTAAFLLATLAPVPPAGADDYDVPLDWPNLQDAIDDAAGNAAPENRIFIGSSPLTGNFTIGADFDAGHTLAILPDREAGLVRATLLAGAMNLPILAISGNPAAGDGHITIQDLDILRRDSGSSSDLVTMSFVEQVTIERCRIGLDMQAPTSAGYANLKILYPVEVIVRNCIFFSRLPGGLDRAVDVQNMIDGACSILLYNNLAADYRLHGFRVIDGASNPAALVLLRNNIAVNSMAVVPEPVGYRSEVDDATIVTSHNVVFASGGFEESLGPGAATIGGGPAASGISMGRPVAPLAFLMTMWNSTPPYDANPTFFRLNAVGPLHDAATDWGQTVGDGAPHARDVAVLLDIECHGRPGGVPVAHTDRGPDQIEPAASTEAGLASPSALGVALDVVAEPNPSRAVRLRFASREAGELTLEIFDLAGRRLASEVRALAPNSRGTWDAALGHGGVWFYRATLRTPDGATHVARGKATLLK